MNENEVTPFPEARLRPNRGARWMVLACLLIMVPVVRRLLTHEDIALDRMITSAVYAAMTGWALWNSRGGLGLRASPEGLWVGDRLRLRRGQIGNAMVVTEGHQPLVVLSHTAMMRSVIEVSSVEQGRALVRALGLASTQSTSQYLFDSPLRQRVSLLPMLGILLGPMLGGFYLLARSGAHEPSARDSLTFGVVLLCTLWAGAWSLLYSASRKLTVGLDGVLVSWLTRKRLVPFRQIAAIRSNEQGVTLVLEGGERLSLTSRHLGRTGIPEGFSSHRDYFKAVARQLREAQATSQPTMATSPTSVAALPTRGEREAQVWLHELRTFLDPERQDFRHALPEPEQLWAAVEDHGGVPERRVAAAVALAPTLDAVGRERLRAAGGAVANPRLRVALEAASEQDDEALVEALGKLEADAAAGVRRGA